MSTPIQKRLDASAKKMELLKALLKKQGIETSSEKSLLLQVPLQRVEREQALPLSFAQQRLWFLDQLEPDSAAYTIPLALRLRGMLDLPAFLSSLQALIERHEVLRTTFASHEGQPVQHITPDPVLDYTLLDLSHLPDEERASQEHAWLAHEQTIPFDLQRGPLLRVRLLRHSSQDHLLLLLFHHIVFDGWSLQVLLRDMVTLYQAALSGEPASLPALPIQYADYAAWQRAWLQGERLEEQLGYWQQQLRGTPAFLDLPTDFPRPPQQTFRGHSLIFHWPVALRTELERLSQQEGATLFMTLLAAFAILLFRYTAQDDIAIGTPIANRSRPEIEGLIGFFVNTLVLRTDLSGTPDFREVLRRVREVALGAYSHQDLPFEQVVDAVQPPRDASRSPLFQVMFSLETPANATLSLPGLQVEALEIENEVAKFDLNLFMQVTPDGLQGELEYNCDLFAQESIQRLIEHWTILVQDLVAHPSRPISQLALLSTREQRSLLREWNAAQAAEKTTQRIHELFEEQVEQTPDAIALRWGEDQWSYRQLNERANQLARQLQTWGVRAETPVGLCLRRGPFLLLSLLAVLKAGGAYVPLDPAYPADRLAFMAQDAQLPLILTQQDLREQVPDTGARVCCVEQARWGTLSAENLEDRGNTDHLAYIIYTSGSTGRPKGVMIAHRNTVALLQWARAHFSAQEMAGVLASTSVCFDVSVFELFAPLCSGGCVIMAEDLLQLSSFVDNAQITMICAVPSVLAELLHSTRLPASIQSVNFAGEALSQKLAQQAYECGTVERVRNIYGPTEDTTYSTWALLERGAVVAPPLGEPLPGGEVYVLDRALQAVPIGAVGEIFLGGVGLARGYWHRPDLTAERFIPHPFSTSPGARLYRTGDLGRRLADGTLEYLGRADHQVKIRGMRIELGEITARLQAHPLVQECLVLAQKGRREEKELVAYLTGEATPEELRPFLQEQLPGYMVPAYFVHLDAFPLLANGKVDRSALPVPGDQRIDGIESYVAPRNPIEAQLVSIWEEVLQRDQVSITDNFFEIGGHSLLAVTLINRMKTVFQRDIPLAALFRSATIQTFAELLQEPEPQQSKVDSPQVSPLQQVAREQGMPLSFAQQRLWFLDQLEPDSVVYTIPLALRLRGTLDLHALQSSLRALIERHEVLHTTFASHGDEPVQRISPDPALDFELLDLSHLPDEECASREKAWLAHQQAIPFDLQHGPLLRVRLLRHSSQEHLLLLLFHHIIFDGWSLPVLQRDLAALYQATLTGEPVALPALPIQYADYAAWLRSWLQGERLEEQLNYWQQQLRGAPAVLDLPTDFPRSPQQTFRGRNLTFHWPLELRTELERLSQQEGATLFMTLLGAWQVLLSRYTGQQDIVVGTPIANRSRPEIEGLIGFFVNTLVLRTDLSGNPDFREVLRRVREGALGAYSHQDIPFEQIVDAVQPPRDVSRSPLFQVMFVLETPSQTALTLPGLRIESVETEGEAAKFDLSLFMQIVPDGLGGVLEYNCDLFTQETMQRLIKHWGILVRDLVAHPSHPVNQIALLSAREQHHLLQDWNATRQVYETATRRIHEVIEEQVERTPDAVALRWGEEQWSYRQFNEQANQLARQLQAWGVRAETPVGICLRRSPLLLLSLLAILKAGGAYVPLDPAYPAERLAFMAQDAQLLLILTQRDLCQRLPDTDAYVYCVEEEQAEWSTLPTENLESQGSADHLAYLIYTSGSTGQPKGVMITHAGLVNYLTWSLETYGRSGGRGAPLHSSVSFDLTVTSTFLPLLMGEHITICPESEGSGIEALEQALRLEGDFTLVKVTPAHLEVLGQSLNMTELDRRSRVLILGGEALFADHLVAWRTHAPGTRLINEYGPTETVVGCSIYEVTDTEKLAGVVPIGKPIANMQLYVLDRWMQPVPIGVTGELYIGGVGVARGYVNRPDLTAERFVPNPFRETGERLYRTGDLAKYRADGNLVYLGRQDSQVKIRGYRIELGEIEAALQKHPGIRECAVVVREDGSGHQKLVAYLVPDGSPPQASELRAALQHTLPGYMLPSQFVLLEVFPLTFNGKIDRQALPAPGRATTEASESYTGPRNPIEAQLVSIWEEMLQRSPIGITDNFFEIGGHSLLAITLLNRIKTFFRQDIPLAALFHNATIQTFAELLQEPEQQQEEVSTALVPIQSQGTKIPLTFIHPVGGEIFCYKELADELGEDQPFYALRFPFTEESEQFPLRIEQVAAHYINALRAARPHGPYILGGWSLGGTIAYAMAHQLRAQGEEVPALVFIDSYAPALFREESDDVSLLLEMAADLAYSIGYALPDEINLATLRGELSRTLIQLSPQERPRFIWEQGQKMGMLPTNFTLSQFRHLFFTFKTNTMLVRDYTPVQDNQRILLFAPDEEAERGSDEANGWSVLNERPLELYPLPGTHYTLLRKPCVALLAERLRVLL